MAFINMICDMLFDSDLEKSNLFVGKIIDGGGVKSEILAFDQGHIKVKILEVSDRIIQRYLDPGKEYSLFPHEWWSIERGMLIWEIPPEQMKRDVSQILLAWEKELGWSWFSDF